MAYYSEIQQVADEQLFKSIAAAAATTTAVVITIAAVTTVTSVTPSTSVEPLFIQSTSSPLPHPPAAS